MPLLSRDSAFARPVPDGWLPQKGDYVFVSPVFSRKRKIARVAKVEPPYVVVSLFWLRHKRAVLSRDVLRPVPKREQRLWFAERYFGRRHETY